MNNKKVIIVTGLSGAGRSTALKILEDLGYEAVDNLPLSLLSLVVNNGTKTNIAIGIDIRSRDFSGTEISKFIKKNRENMNLELVFFECESEVLIDRYKATRRLHPLKLDIPIKDIIEQERVWLAPLKKIADYIVDSSNLELPALNNTLSSFFQIEKQSKLNIRVLSFGYKFGLPREADIVMDVRFIKNPYYIEKLKNLTGKDTPVINYLEKQEIYNSFLKKITSITLELFPVFKSEGKKYLTIAFGCTGGIHRSVAIAEKFYNNISNAKFNVFIDHRDLKK
tara:strand:+ start:317 stop:1162 length:846 start_codon:yes stop_codon:yes gene_type:complete